ncbi:MAG: MGH1-like glycoside hydrolase domain-containing protein [Gemmatimonadaceae bacterium]
MSVLPRAMSVALLAATTSGPLVAQGAVYRSRAFTLTDTSVQQGRFRAVAVSRDRIESTYPRAAREVMFKFSINGRDNEFPPGQDHMIYVRPPADGGRIVTPVYRFGVLDAPLEPRPEDAPARSAEGSVLVTFRLDMRHVLASFRDSGAYDPPNGPPLTAADFQGVYIVGNAEPLGWDFSVLRPGSRFELTDPEGDGIYTVTLPFEAAYTRPADSTGRGVWSLRRDISRFPQLESSQRLVDALYRMSLEELLDLVRDDGALAAGARWPDVWTRDVSWGAMLSFTPIAPDAVRTSLMAKVDSAGRMIQDTGTGGSWPVSTDRVAWAVAAWELYAVTGDREWLRRSYDIVKRSVEADLLTAFDSTTGLFRGESSFLDWREQSYPRWMDPKDIYLSQSLGTNALHYATYRVLARMAAALGEPAARWERIAARVRRGMNEHLWQAGQGYYGQFRYGRTYLSLSPRAEHLGEALSIIYGAADSARRARVVRSTPLVPFGVPSFWPYIPDIPPYHNAGIWPQVVGFWAWASAEAGNGVGVEHALASIYRAAALFLTNKENMVAATGHFEGTELNSDRLIGSVAANLATVYRVLFGMRFEEDRLLFEPFVPRTYDGERTLRGLRYRDAVLTVTVRGFGNAPGRVLLDGRRVARAEIPAALTGAHTLEITMNGVMPASRITIVETRTSPGTPVVRLESDRLIWEPADGAASYRVYRNGRPLATRTDTSHRVAPRAWLDEYQVLAVDRRGARSFLSEPVRVAPESATVIAEAETGASGRAAATAESRVSGYTGSGYLSLTTERDTVVTIPVSVPAAGDYSIDARYANGSGPVNSSDRAAVRSLFVGRTRIGATVMPQRGTDLWDDWGYSSPVRVRLSDGEHVLTLSLTAADRNMSRRVNEALLDHVRVTRVGR